MERLTVWAEAPLGCSCWELKGAGNMECREVCDLQERGCQGCVINQAIDKLAEYGNIDPDPGSILFHFSYNSLWTGFAVGAALTIFIQQFMNWIGGVF